MKKGEAREYRIYRSKKEMMWNNFLGGLSWALGATLGIAIIIGVLTIIASYINFIPFFGNFFSQVIDYILKTNSHFGK